MEIEELRKIALSLLKNIDGFETRDIKSEIERSLDTGPRIKILRGFRGVGKTTLMLQLFNEKKERSIYLSADWPFVTKTGLYETIRSLVEAGYTLLFIDEVHKSPNWRDEIKSIHDQFAQITLVCSGSAALAFTPDRREIVFDIEPMTLGEYLRLRYHVSTPASAETWNKKEAIDVVAMLYPRIEGWFFEYVEYGGFPVSLIPNYSSDDVMNAIYFAIMKSVREDSVSFLKLSNEKIFAMEKLLIFFATSSPGELSITSLSSSLRISKTVVYEIIDALINMKLLRLIRPSSSGAALVRGEPKLIFTHPNLRVAICKQLKESYNFGAVREELAVFGFVRKGWKINTIKGAKKSPDYILETGKQKLVVEIGGASKNRSQLAGFENIMLIKDEQIITLLL